MSASPLVGIVANVRNPGPSIRSFVRYHLALGVHRMYLLFDDADDRWRGEVPHDPRVTVMESKELEERPLLVAGDDTEASVERERRYGNAGLRLARADGLDWLFHLDTDEAFCLFGESLSTHFAELMEDGIENAKYLNYEGVAERADIEDYFLEVSLFKRNPLEIRDDGQEGTLQRLTQQMPQIPERFFFSYVYGKSAVRVLPGVRALGRHGFSREPRLRAELITRPAVLHYMNAGVSNFLRYHEGQKRLPLWSDRDGASAFEVDLDAPDAAATVHRFYEDRVVLREAEWKKQLCDAGLCVHVDAVQGVLRATTDEQRDAAGPTTVT